MLYIGYHLSSVNGFEAMGLEAMKAGANTFAFFTRNPRGGGAEGHAAAPRQTAPHGLPRPTTATASLETNQSRPNRSSGAL